MEATGDGGGVGGYSGTESGREAAWVDLGGWLEARMAREMSWEKMEGEERTGPSVEKEDMVDVGVGGLLM